MVRRVLAGVVFLVLTLFAVTLVKGDGPGSGDVFWAPTADYGVNTGDLPVVVMWLLGTVCCAVLFFRPRR